MDKKKTALTTALITVALLISDLAEARDQRLPARLQHHNLQFKRCSRGELKAFRFIHVGYAALYKKNCQKIKNIFSKSAKQLRFAYDRDIPGKAFREASEEYLKTNLAAKYKDWQQSIEQFNSGYQDIKEGDFYDLIYQPETGLMLYLNKKKLAELNNPEIGLAYLNIWFGKKPFSENLKESLLTHENYKTD